MTVNKAILVGRLAGVRNGFGAGKCHRMDRLAVVVAGLVAVPVNRVLRHPYRTHVEPVGSDFLARFAQQVRDKLHLFLSGEFLHSVARLLLHHVELGAIVSHAQ